MANETIKKYIDWSYLLHTAPHEHAILFLLYTVFRRASDFGENNSEEGCTLTIATFMDLCKEIDYMWIKMFYYFNSDDIAYP